jgi:L-ribulose-5-phosphate 4-epimerase
VLRELKEAVCEANLALVKHGLVTLTWGNVSGLSSDRKHVVIKPSGVSYDQMSPDDMVVVDLNGKVVDGDLRPSSDTATHVLLYRQFDQIEGITHTHSTHATAFAQARVEIPCLGTTHADHFYGAVPVTRPLTEQEVQQGYEQHTGLVIIERFRDLDPMSMPAVLVAGHAPFVWGASPGNSVRNAVALEAVATMALATRAVCPQPPLLEHYVLQKHHDRKHGKRAYYGQEN